LDYDGKFCGYSKGYTQFRYIYFADIETADVSDLFDSATCVSECPGAAAQTVDCHTTEYTKSCSAFPIYATYTFLRVCLPDLSKLDPQVKANYAKIYDTFIGNSIGPYIADLADTWFVVLGSVFLSVAIALLYIAAMKFMARILAWISIALILVGLVGMGAFFWYLDGKVAADNPAEDTSYYVWAALGCWVVAFLYMVAIFFLWRSLSISIAIIECASDFVGTQKRSVLVPVFSFIVMLVIFVGWVWGMVCIASVGTISAGGAEGSQARHVIWDENVRGMIWYMFFGFLWLMAFVLACSQFVIIVGVCSWYFSHNSDNEGDASFTDGFKWIFQYHLGSLAFGSFIVAVVWLIRIVFETIRKKIETGDPTQNPAVKCLLCCCSCCLACIDKFV